MDQNPDSVNLRTYVNAAPENVWRILSTKEGLSEWLGAKEYEPFVGGKVRFEVKQGSEHFIITGAVEEMIANERLSFTWLEEKVGSYKWPRPTQVTIGLTRFHSGTLVTLEHSGFRQLPSEISLREFLEHLAGWTMYHYPFNDFEAILTKYAI